MAAKEKQPKIRQNRFKKGQRQRTRRWPGRLIAGLKLTAIMMVLMTASAVFVVVYGAVTQSDYFGTQSILISGNQRLTQADVLNQAAIKKGDNLLALNLRIVRQRLLSNPWIDDACVTRQIPDTISIRVVEHEPLAQVDLGGTFLMDTKGRIFKEVTDEDAWQIPLITGIGYIDISLGDDQLSSNIESLLRVLALSKRDNSVIAYTDIEQMHLDREMGISLTLNPNSVNIILGFKQYETKFAQFQKLRRHLNDSAQWGSYKAIDLNNPNRVVVRFG